MKPLGSWRTKPLDSSALANQLNHQGFFYYLLYMNRLFLFTLFIASFYSYSQDTDEPVRVRYNLPGNPENTDPARGDQGRVFTVKGSPYLNEIHKEGVIINGAKKTKALLRYNAYYDSFQILDENKKKSFLLKSPTIKVMLDSTTYQLITYEETVRDRALYYLPNSSNKSINGNKREGYFSILSDGETTLYQKTFKRVPKFKQAEHGYERFEPSAFVTITHYYIKRKHRPAVRIKLSKKEVLLALNNKYNEVRDFIKKNKLKVKTVEEVIQLISYYDTLD